MQLIKDFSDIPRFVSFLNADYQQKLLFEINSLVIRFMDEQTRVPAPVQETPQEPKTQPVLNNQAVEMPGIPQPIINQTPPPVQEQQVMTDTANGINNLRNAFNKGNNMANNPPPPPPPTTINVQPPQLGRTIASGGFNLKANMVAAKPQNKKSTISVVEAFGYITPVLTDVGIEIAKNPAISTETYKLLKQINGQSTLKEIYLFLYPSTNHWGKFIDRIYPMYHERAVNLRKSRSYPSDLELSVKFGEMVIALGLIDDLTMEKALEYQKNPPAPQQNPVPQQSTQGMSWIERTKSIVGQTAEVEAVQHVKKKLGDVMVEMKLITKDELSHILTLQKWIKNIIQHS